MSTRADRRCTYNVKPSHWTMDQWAEHNRQRAAESAEALRQASYCDVEVIVGQVLLVVKLAVVLVAAFVAFG